MKSVLLSILFFSLSPAFADEPEQMTESPHFRAWGEHTCWSETSIGHRCRVEEVGFTDCNQAYFTLSHDDCCHHTEYGGGSVGFELKLCTWWH